MNTKFLSAVLFLILILTTPTCEDKLEIQPAVKTGVVNTVTTKNASVQGIIIDLGDGIGNHGHCFGLVPDPTVAGEKTNFGQAGRPYEYTSELKNLTPGTTYFVRAYVTSGDKTYYGEDVSFTTMDGQAEVSTATVVDVGLTTARSGGSVSSAGGDEVLRAGVCWDTTESFRLATCQGSTMDQIGLGIFESDNSR